MSRLNGTLITPIEDVSVTTTPIKVANANKRRVALNVTNTHASIHVRWGDSNVTASKGQQIRAGVGAEIRCLGEVWMVAESGTVSMAMTEEATGVA